MALASLSQGEPDISEATMELVRCLSRALHYPVSKNSTCVQGLLVKYRVAVSRCLDRIEELQRSGGGGTRGDSARNSADGSQLLLEERLHSLDRQLMQAQLECNTAKQDGMRVYKVLELFKSKYSKLVEEKAAQAKELIEASACPCACARAWVPVATLLRLPPRRGVFSDTRTFPIFRRRRRSCSLRERC